MGLSGSASPERALSVLSGLTSLGQNDSPEARAAARAVAAGLIPMPSTLDESADAVAAATQLLSSKAGLPNSGGQRTNSVVGEKGGVGGGATRANRKANSFNANAPGDSSSSLSGAEVDVRSASAVLTGGVGGGRAASGVGARRRPVQAPKAGGGGLAEAAVGPSRTASAAGAAAETPKAFGLAGMLGGGSGGAESGGAGMAPQQATPPTGVAADAGEDEYEYYDPEEEAAGTNPQLTELSRLTAVADEARRKLDEARGRESVATAALAEAEAAQTRIDAEQRSLQASVDATDKVETEVSNAREHEQGLRRMVAQQEQSLEDARAAARGQKKRLFGKGNKDSEAEKAVKEEETKLNLAKEKLEAAVSKLNSLLGTVEEMSSKAARKEEELQTMRAKAAKHLDDARAAVATAEAERRDAETTAADAAAAAERERITPWDRRSQRGGRRRHLLSCLGQQPQMLLWVGGAHASLGPGQFSKPGGCEPRHHVALHDRPPARVLYQ